MKEDQHTEFKQSWRDEYMQYVSGFANAQGGTLYVGVDDNGNVCGTNAAHKLLVNLPNQINQTTGVLAEVNLLTEGGMEYVEIRVKPSSQPVSYKGKYYYRSGATLQEMNGAALRDFLFDKVGIAFDAMPCENAKYDDIDRGAIDFFLNNAIKAGRISSETLHDSTEKILQNLDLVADDGRLKNAAVLLFGKNPQHFFISSRFRLGRFGTRESDLIFQDEVAGNIIQMADRVVWLLRSKYLKTPIHYEGLRRIEELEIPEPAMRELIYNAIIHRDYMGYDIQMKVYDDRIWLWNSGELPEGYNTTTLQQPHMSKPRNKLIAGVFYKAGFIENWGRGFDKIQTAFTTAEIPFPTIENAFGGASVTIPRAAAEEDTTHGGENTQEGSEKSSEKSSEKIIGLIKNKPSISAKEIAAVLGVSDRSIEKHIKRLREQDLIRRVGSAKGGHWEIIRQDEGNI